MTVIVGLLCSEGIVIASDSQESDDEQGLKRLDVKKVYDTSLFNLEDGDIELLVGGTGTSALISRAVELIDDKVFAPRFSLPRQVADVIESVIGQMRRRYAPQGQLNLELMVGIYCKDAPKTAGKDERRPKPIALYAILPPSEEDDEKVGVAEVVTDYSAMGTGGLFARYLLNRLHDDDHPASKLTMDAAVREAIYVISEVVKVDLWCGGDIQLVCIRQSKSDPEKYVLDRKKPDEIKALLDELVVADKDIKVREREMIASEKPR